MLLRKDATCMHFLFRRKKSCQQKEKAERKVQKEKPVAILTNDFQKKFQYMTNYFYNLSIDAKNLDRDVKCLRKCTNTLLKHSKR